MVLTSAFCRRDQSTFSKKLSLLISIDFTKSATKQMNRGMKKQFIDLIYALTLRNELKKRSLFFINI